MSLEIRLQRAAMRQAAGYKPAGNMVINEDMRQAMVRQRAMEICLKRFFDGVIEGKRSPSSDPKTHASSLLYGYSPP